MVSGQIYASECDSFPSLEPLATLIPILFGGENRNEHAVAEKVGFFDHIGNGEPSDAFRRIFGSEEEPVVIAVGIEIILDKQVELPFLLRVDISPDHIATLKISID